MLSSSSASELDQNGNGRDRTHLTLDLKDLKPREASNSGLSPISLPISLLDSSLLMSPEKFLLAAQQHHQNLQQQQQSQAQQLLQQPKLETPTPSNFIFPKNVTTAQETFAEGFHKALQKLQGDSSLPTFQNNSPSTVKFLLSLAALTPTLSPSAPNKQFLSQQVNNNGGDLNNLAAAAAADRRLDLPKIVVNSLVPALSSSSAAASNPTEPAQPQLTSQTANDIAKRYMEYFQIGQHQQQQLHNISSSSSASTSNSSVDFLQQHQATQFHAPPPAHLGGIGQQQQAAKPPQPPIPNEFIKSEQQEQLLLADQSMLRMAQQMNGGGAGSMMGSNSGVSPNLHAQPQLAAVATGSKKQTLNGEVPEVVKKLERKRARNRLAASKCRQRKLQRISDLELQVAQERERGTELQDEIVRLQTIIASLQEKLHGTGGAELNRQPY